MNRTQWRIIVAGIFICAVMCIIPPVRSRRGGQYAFAWELDTDLAVSRLVLQIVAVAFVTAGLTLMPQIRLSKVSRWIVLVSVFGAPIAMVGAYAWYAVRVRNCVVPESELTKIEFEFTGDTNTYGNSPWDRLDYHAHNGTGRTLAEVTYTLYFWGPNTHSHDRRPAPSTGAIPATAIEYKQPKPDYVGVPPRSWGEGGLHPSNLPGASYANWQVKITGARWAWDEN